MVSSPRFHFGFQEYFAGALMARSSAFVRHPDSRILHATCRRTLDRIGRLDNVGRLVQRQICGMERDTVSTMPRGPHQPLRGWGESRWFALETMVVVDHAARMLGDRAAVAG